MQGEQSVNGFNEGKEDRVNNGLDGIKPRAI